MIPSANTANDENAPPENRFKNPIAPCSRADSRSWETATSSMPGTRMNDPSRYTATIATVKRILFRRSLTLKTFFRFDSTVVAPQVAARWGRDEGGSAVGELVARDRRTAL